MKHLLHPWNLKKTTETFVTYLFSGSTSLRSRRLHALTVHQFMVPVEKKKRNTQTHTYTHTYTHSLIHTLIHTHAHKHTILVIKSIPLQNRSRNGRTTMKRRQVCECTPIAPPLPSWTALGPYSGERRKKKIWLSFTIEHYLFSKYF